MFTSSPISVWEGAAAFFNWAGTGGAVFWFWVMVALCLLPVCTAFLAENTAESKHGGE